MRATTAILGVLAALAAALGTSNSSADQCNPDPTRHRSSDEAGRARVQTGSAPAALERELGPLALGPLW